MGMVVEKGFLVKYLRLARSGFFGLFIDSFSQFSADSERRNFFGRDFDNFSGAGVATLIRFVVFVAKRAEASQFDPAVFIESSDYGLEAGIDDHFSLVVGEEGLFLQSCNEFRFGHTSV